MRILRFFSVLLVLFGLAACMPQARTAEGDPIVQRPYSSNLVYARSPELLKEYRTFLVEKPVIMQTEGVNFPDVTLEEKETMLFFTQQAYAQALLRNNFSVVKEIGPKVARVKIYVVDMRPSQEAAPGTVYQTPSGDVDLSDVDFRGRSTFTGGVTLGGTITDSENGKVLMGFVESSSQTNLDPVRAFERWFPTQSAIENSANSLAIGWRSMLSR